MTTTAMTLSMHLMTSAGALTATVRKVRNIDGILASVLALHLTKLSILAVIPNGLAAIRRVEVKPGTTDTMSNQGK